MGEWMNGQTDRRMDDGWMVVLWRDGQTAGWMDDGQKDGLLDGYY